MTEHATRMLVTNLFNSWNHGEILSLQAIVSFLGATDRQIVVCCPYAIVDKKMLPEGVSYSGRESRRASGLRYYLNVLINLFYLMKELRRCTVVLDVGGDTISDQDGVVYTLAHCASILLSHVFSKPVIVMPQTILPFKYGFTRRIAKAALNSCLGVFVREQRGYDYLRSLGVKVDGICFDLAFLTLCTGSKREERFGVNLSKYLHTRCGHHPEVLAVLKRLDREIAYVPHVLGDEARSDLPLCTEFSQECKGTVFLSTAEDTRRFISSLSFLVAERYHAIISALSTCTPVLAISLSIKVQDLITDFGLRHYLIDPRDPNFHDILNEKLTDMLNRHADIEASLKLRVAPAQDMARDLVGRIDDCIMALRLLQ